MAHHALLKRQLKRLELDAGEPSLAKWNVLLETVDRTYREADQDRYTIERSLSVSSRELREQHERAEIEARRWKLISDVAGVVATSRDYEALQRSMLASLRRELPVQTCAFFEIEGDEIFLASPCGEISAMCPPERRMTWNRGYWTEALREGRVVVFSNESDRAMTFELTIEESALRSSAVLPVFIGGALQGIFLIARSESFRSEELALLHELAPHVANAIANVRSHLKSEQLNQARDRLSMLLVHDFKNPLSVVKMSLEVGADSSMSDTDRADALADGRLAADQLLEMIVDLLDVGLAEAGRLPVRRKPTDAAGLLRDVLAAYGARARSRGLKLTLLADSNLQASLDSKLIRRVVENVLNNALRYAPFGGCVEVGVHNDGDWLLIRIGNDGPPIAPDVRELLFEKYGVVSAGQEHSNRGLGLYFSRLVLEAHDGSISIADRSGGGVCFEIRMPAIVAETRASGLQSQA